MVARKFHESRPKGESRWWGSRTGITWIRSWRLSLPMLRHGCVPHSYVVLIATVCLIWICRWCLLGRCRRSLIVCWITLSVLSGRSTWCTIRSLLLSILVCLLRLCSATSRSVLLLLQVVSQMVSYVRVARYSQQHEPFPL